MRIGILGVGGRMGRMLVREVLRTPGAELSGGTERVDAPGGGRDLGELAGQEMIGIRASANPIALFEASDAVIDFTQPTALGLHASLALQSETPLIVGTTGLGTGEQAALDEAASTVAIVQSANFCIGVTLLTSVVERVAAALAAESWDIEILEMHHRMKVDAPSGTALALGEAAARGRMVRLENASVRSRDGQTGARRPGDIGFATLRGGDVVGDHTVMFAGNGERLELSHKASSRDVFAAGAVRAALWTRGRSPGRYGMADVLGLGL